MIFACSFEDRAEFGRCQNESFTRQFRKIPLLRGRDRDFYGVANCPGENENPWAGRPICAIKASQATGLANQTFQEHSRPLPSVNSREKVAPLTFPRVGLFVFMKSEPKRDPKKMADESLLDQLRALPRVVWILGIGLFIHRFGTFVVPFLTLYLKKNGYTAFEIGVVFAALAVGGIGAMVASGRLSDLIGRKDTMTLSLFGGALSMILMWQANSWATFCFSAFFSGLMMGMYHPASNSLLVDVVPPDRRVTAFGVVRWAVNLGFALGMAAAGFLAKNDHYDILFIGDAVTSAIFGLVAYFTLPHGIRTSKEESKWGPAIRNILGNRRFVAFFWANFFAVMAFFHWGSSVARLIVDLGYTEAVYGWLMAGNGLVIAFCELPISQIGRRFPFHRMIAVGFFLCGAGVWLNAFADGWIVVAVALGVFTLGEMISMCVSGAYVGQLAPETMRGRYSAAVGLTWNLGHAIAPGAGLLLYENCPAALWWGSLLLAFLSAGLMLFPFGKREKPRAEEIASSV